MIKKVPVDRLVPGMYVHDLNCGWMDHPFMRSQFRIEDAGQVEKIRSLGIRHLYVDTERGLDLADAPTAPEVDQALERDMVRTAEQGGTQESETTLAGERGRARRIQQEAGQLVTGLMEDVRLGRQIEVERVNPVVGRMVDSIFRNKDALLGLTRIRRMDRYTFEHSVSVSVLMVSFARSLELDRDLIREIGVGALLHDMGKTRVPGRILNKPGRLDEQEMAVMRSHVVHSRDILAQTPGIPPVALAVAAEHHERIDGSGYPDNKRGESISRYGQMASVVDVYDAISADRVYHKGLAPHLTLRKLLEWSGHHFDPELVQRFIQCVGIYPVGSVVRLESGRIGLVLESGRQGLLQPVVRLLVDADSGRRLTPRDLDLSAPEAADRIVAAESAERWRIDPRLHLEEAA